MKVAGIVAEYNPFHTGHKFHIDKTREVADGIICLMSGAFTQRGTPGIINKWARAKCAIESGADLVLELPFPFSCAPAEIFAGGSVDLLNKLAVADYISFGSEKGEIKPLKTCAKILLENGREISENIRKNAGQGNSYAMEIAKQANLLGDEETLSSPNNLLGIKYIMALEKSGSSIKPYTIKRDNNYNNPVAEGEFASAMAVREMIKNEDTEKIKKYLPVSSFDILKAEMIKEKIYDISNLDSLFCGILRRENIEKYAYVAEGIENRFASMAEKYSTIQEIIGAVKTKRYTYTRLSRIAASVLVGLDKATLKENIKGGVAYVKILGANDKGMAILKEIKKKGNIPLVSKGADYVRLNAYGKKQFELEMKAKNIASLSCNNVKYRISNLDLINSPYIKRT